MSIRTGKPASFIKNNSKGEPDFVMTLLVWFAKVVIYSSLVWAAVNLIVLGLTQTDASNEVRAFTLQYLVAFNDGFWKGVVGICGVTGSLASAYYLRRKNSDQNKLELMKVQARSGLLGWASDFVDNAKSTIGHKNYDPSKEDI